MLRETIFVRKSAIATNSLLLALALLFIGQASLAQIIRNDYSLSWSSTGKNDTLPALVTATYTDGNCLLFDGVHENDVIDSLLYDRAFTRHRPHGGYYVETCDSSEALFYARRITAASAGEYEYRILLNARTPIVPWRPVSYNATTIPAPGKKGMLTLLGAYKTSWGNYLVVDLRKKGTDSIISYTTIFWNPVQPVLLNIYTTAELNEFFKKLNTPFSFTLTENEINKWRKQYSPDELDAITFLPKKLVLPPNNNSLIFFLRADIRHKEQVEYQLLKEHNIYCDWKTNDFDRPFIWLENLPAGHYQLNIRYVIQRQRVTSYSFEIKKNWYETLAFKIIECGLIIAFLGFILLLWSNFRQKRKFTEEQQKKERLEADMRALRAQLNPHFIFNALGSIQGLINNGELDSANNYLSDFATLMRDVLNEKNNDHNVLEYEIQILENYLKLEQLRFHFTYTITVAKTIQPSVVQIPALLLQPLVENAVKHGVSSLQERGQIDINFVQNNNDLLVHITDNGSGFDTHNTPYGYGLQLTRKRITFANKISGTQSIFMEIHSGTGTSVTITFQNWLT